MKTFFAYYVETFKNIVTSEPLVATLILSIFFYGIFYPTAYEAQQPEGLPIVIVDQEHSTTTTKIITALMNNPDVNVKVVTGNFLEAKQLVQEEKAEGILLLPYNLSKSLHRGENGGIGLYLAASNLLASKKIGLGLAITVETVLAKQIEAWGHITQFKPQIPIHQIPLYNTLEGYGSYVFPAISSLIVHQTILLGLGMLIAGYREKMWATNLKEYLAIYTALLTIGCCGCLYFFGFVFWMYDYPSGGNFWGMILAVPIFVSAVIALAFLVASFVDCAERIGHIIVSTSVPLFLLSGIAWPYEAMPAWIEWIGRVLPSSVGPQTFIQLNQMGVPTSLVIPKLIYLFCFAAIGMILAYYRLSKKPSTT